MHKLLIAMLFASVLAHGQIVNPGGSVTSSAVQTATQPGILATSYGVTGAGGFSFNFTGNSGSGVITCTTCNFSTNATTGQVVFATNLTASGFTNQSVLKLAQGTLTVNSNTQITASTTFSDTTCQAAGSCMLWWGTLYDTQMTNAWNAALASCSTLMLPGVNPTGTGPAVIMLSTGPVWANPTALCQGTGGSRSGMGIVGGGFDSTYVVPVPNFPSSACTGGASGVACFVDSTDGGHYRQFTIHGGGVSNPGSGFATKVAFEVDSLNNAYMNDMEFLFWGANQTNGIGTGLLYRGGQIYTYNVGEDGFGNSGRKYVANGNQGVVVEVLCAGYDNYFNNLEQQNGTNPVYTYGCNWGGPQGVFQTFACVVASSIYHSTNDIFGLPTLTANASNGISAGQCVDQSGTTNTAGTVYLSGDLIYGGVNSGTHGMIIVQSTSSAILTNGTLVKLVGSSATNSLFYFNSGGTVTDDGTETYTPGSGIFGQGAGSGWVFSGRGHNLAGACTGVGTAASTLGLYGTGPNETLTTCTSTTIGSGQVMQTAGTLNMLIATASAGGTNGSSGVVTVLKNGSGSTLTCTLGTSTFCADGTHSVSYVAGDLISIQFTTQGADTLAGVKASVLY